MKTAMQLDLSYEQVLSLVKQLPKKQKIKLTKELAKDTVDAKLEELLSAFQTDELSLETINKESELVRQAIYEKQKH